MTVGTEELIPASSQTVGPYFPIGMTYFAERAPVPSPKTEGAATLRGRVLDLDGNPVSDALLEFWAGEDSGSRLSEESGRADASAGFRRAMTDEEGFYSVIVSPHFEADARRGSSGAPHLAVLVFARGLLRQLLTCVYFDGEPANALDPVLLEVPQDRRHTLIARKDESCIFCWDVILQGPNETVFFAW